MPWTKVEEIKTKLYADLGLRFQINWQHIRIFLVHIHHVFGTHILHLPISKSATALRECEYMYKHTNYTTPAFGSGTYIVIVFMFIDSATGSIRITPLALNLGKYAHTQTDDEMETIKQRYYMLQSISKAHFQKRQAVVLKKIALVFVYICIWTYVYIPEVILLCRVCIYDITSTFRVESHRTQPFDLICYRRVLGNWCLRISAAWSTW